MSAFGAVADLLDEARSETGLDDFGADTFREGLEILVAALRDEARLNAVGERAMRRQVVGHLSQRLQVEDWYRRHPEIADEALEPALIGLGLPRTGSTALSVLLGHDPEVRSLRWFESNQPCPPPSTVRGPDPRIARMERSLALQDKFMPRIKHLVPVTATAPGECLDLMALDFKSQAFEAYARIPSYSSWLLYRADLSTAYAYHRRVLRLLQWGTPARPWRLKAPAHMVGIAALANAFPDARFVMTHRDVVDVIPSIADLYSELANPFTEELDRHYLGELNVETWSVGMTRTLDFRADNEDRFYDIDFRQMQSEPIETVRSLYAWLGAEVSAEFEAGMRRWWQTSAVNREQIDRPGPEAFGIDVDALGSLFARYTQRFSTAERDR
ncbi:MAG: sulfotransferase [Mycolicibacterium sp.]|nr:sulfotransferase [Mycobacterium sp.]MCB0939041.1 sulfotransferase [Mycobacterium sp.]MCB9415861.1 sulfotransferase [Mycolicibacterium sp.]